MRIITCLVSVCIACSIGGTSFASPGPNSVASARANSNKQANRDHFRHKKYYQNGQGVNESAQAEPAPSRETSETFPEADAFCCLDAVPFSQGPRPMAPAALEL